MSNLNELQKEITFNYGGNDRVKQIESSLEKGDFKSFWQEVRKDESFPKDFDKSIYQETDGISFCVNEIEGEQLESLKRKVQFDTSNILNGKVSYIDEKSSQYIKMSLKIGEKSEVVLLTQKMFNTIKDSLSNEKSIKKFIIDGFPDIDKKLLKVGKLEGNGFDREIDLSYNNENKVSSKLSISQRIGSFKEKVKGIKSRVKSNVTQIISDIDDKARKITKEQRKGVEDINTMIESIRDKLWLDDSQKIKFSSFIDKHSRLDCEFYIKDNRITIFVHKNGEFLLFKNGKGLKNDGSYKSDKYGESISNIDIIKEALLEIAGEYEIESITFSDEGNEKIQEGPFEVLDKINDLLIINFDGDNRLVYKGKVINGVNINGNIIFINKECTNIKFDKSNNKRNLIIKKENETLKFNLDEFGTLKEEDFIIELKYKQESRIDEITEIIQEIDDSINIDFVKVIDEESSINGWYVYDFKFKNHIINIRIAENGSFFIRIDGVSCYDNNENFLLEDINVLKYALNNLRDEQEIRINEITKIIKEFDDSIEINSKETDSCMYFGFKLKNHTIEVEIFANGSYCTKIDRNLLYDNNKCTLNNTDILKNALNNLIDLQQEGVKKISEMIESMRGKLGLDNSQEIKFLDYNDENGRLWYEFDFNNNLVQIGVGKDGKFLLFKKDESQENYIGLKSDGSYNDTNNGEWISDINIIEKALLEIALTKIDSIFISDIRGKEIKQEGPFNILNKINDNLLIVEFLGMNRLVYNGYIIDKVSIDGEVQQINLAGTDVKYLNGTITIEKKDGNSFKLEINLDYYKEPEFENFILKFESKEELSHIFNKFIESIKNNNTGIHLLGTKNGEKGHYTILNKTGLRDFEEIYHKDFPREIVDDETKMKVLKARESNDEFSLYILHIADRRVDPKTGSYSQIGLKFNKLFENDFLKIMEDKELAKKLFETIAEEYGKNTGLIGATDKVNEIVLLIGK